MERKDERILLGEISGVFGIQGWVKVFSYTMPREKITEYKDWQLKTASGWKRFKVLQGREQGKNVVAQLDGVTDRNQAEALIGSKVAVKSEQLEVLPPGEFYWKDLIGLSVETVNGQNLGVIDWIFETGSNSVIVVKGEEIGEPERLIPYLMDDVVVSVDLNKSLMIVDWDYDF